MSSSGAPGAHSPRRSRDTFSAIRTVFDGWVIARLRIRPNGAANSVGISGCRPSTVR